MTFHYQEITGEKVLYDMCYILKILYLEKPPDSAHLLESYVVPLKGVITAAAHSNSQELHSKASVLTAQTQQLSKLAESAAASTQNHDTAR